MFIGLIIAVPSNREFEIPFYTPPIGLILEQPRQTVSTTVPEASSSEIRATEGQHSVVYSKEVHTRCSSAYVVRLAH
jgi:hypothetical protein